MALAAALLFGYPAVATLLLWSGLIEHWLTSKELRVELDKPAWSVWPGSVHLKRIRIFRDGGTQLSVSARRVTADIQLSSLLSKQLRVTSLEADDIQYRMRLRRDGRQPRPARAAAFPPLSGLPAPNAKPEDDSGEPSDGWTVEITGIDAMVTDLWIFEYHFVGSGRLRGGFMAGPDRMRVDDTVQKLESGELRFGEHQVIASNVRGSIRGSIDENAPSQHSDISFFDLIDADLRIDANVESLQHLGAYIDGITVSRGAGRFQARVSLSNGVFSDSSKVHFSSEELRLQRRHIGLTSDWSLKLEANTRSTEASPQLEARPSPATSSQRPAASATPQRDARLASEARAGAGGGDRRPKLRAVSRAESSYLSYARNGAAPFTVQLHDHEHVVTLHSTRVDGILDLSTAKFSFPKIVSVDLDDLEALAGADSKFDSEGGSALASLTLELTDDHTLTGPFELSVEDARLSYGNLGVAGSGRVASTVSVDPARELLALRELNVELDDASFQLADERVERWWLRLSSDRLRATGFPPKRIQTEFDIVAKDAAPVIEGLAETDRLPKLVAKLTSLDGLEVHAKLSKSEHALDIMIETLESQVLDMSGRLYLRGNKQWLALLVGGDVASLGLFRSDEATDIEAFADAAWLNEKLARFPKPTEPVDPPKP